MVLVPKGVEVPALLVLGLAMTMVIAVMTLLALDDDGRSQSLKSLQNKRVMSIKTNLRSVPTIVDPSLPVYMTCDNGSVNNAVFGDNYCDCKDGSDEILTDACSYYHPQELVYECKDPTARTVFMSRVNDNVCDCPNGADEYDSAVICYHRRNIFRFS
jgi:hypothetical protein